MAVDVTQRYRVASASACPRVASWNILSGTERDQVKLPELTHATITEQKLTGYLLSTTHPTGASKARYFIRHGFSAADWQALADAIRRHAAENDVTETEKTPRGISYTVEGGIRAPDGRTLRIRAVWFQDTGEHAPHLVTAYPLKGART